MTLLLDTHVLLWTLSDPARLTRAARKRVEDPGNTVFVSVVSAWEIAIKRALGKLVAPDDLAKQMDARRFTELPLHLRHVACLDSLPALHSDPFDRILIAQSIADGLTLMTADEKVRAYPVATVRA